MTQTNALKKAMLLLMTIVIIMTGCSDKDSPSPSVITMNGQAFSILSVTVLGVSLQGDGHVAISFISTDGTKAKTLTIDVDYDPTKPISGNYAFPMTTGTRYMDDYLTNYNEFTQSSSVSTELQKGTVTIKDNGNSNYTITMDLTMLDGRIFKGTYNGAVQASFNNG